MSYSHTFGLFPYCILAIAFRNEYLMFLGALLLNMCCSPAPNLEARWGSQAAAVEVSVSRMLKTAARSTCSATSPPQSAVWHRQRGSKMMRQAQKQLTQEHQGSW